MLLGLGSLFTSCVDVDYYDLYDDEEEILSPRSKKGKEVVDVDLSVYTKMDDGWYEGECVAFCYAYYYTNGDKVASRYAVIKAEYDDEFNMDTYNSYFEGVENGNDLISGAAQIKLFGDNELYADSFVKNLVETYGTQTVYCNSIHLAIYNTSLNHMSCVNYVEISKNIFGTYKLDFYVTDRKHSCSNLYSATLKKNGTVTTDVGRFRLL